MDRGVQRQKGVLKPKSIQGKRPNADNLDSECASDDVNKRCKIFQDVNMVEATVLLAEAGSQPRRQP